MTNAEQAGAVLGLFERRFERGPVWAVVFRDPRSGVEVARWYEPERGAWALSVATVPGASPCSAERLEDLAEGMRAAATVARWLDAQTDAVLNRMVIYEGLGMNPARVRLGRPSERVVGTEGPSREEG